MTNPGFVMPDSPAAPPSRAGFQDVDTLTNSHGMVSIISQRSKSGELTFGIFRVWTDPLGGSQNRTSFIPESLTEAFIDLAGLTITRMRELREGGNLPFGPTGTARRPQPRQHTPPPRPARRRR